MPKPMNPVAGDSAPMMYLEDTGTGVPATGPLHRHSTFSGASGVGVLRHLVVERATRRTRSRPRNFSATLFDQALGLHLAPRHIYS